MKSVQELPEGYKEIFSVDMQKDKKMAIFVNLLAAIVMLAMIIPMHFHISFFTLFDMSKGFIAYLVRWGILMIGMIAYIILHELVHGITMKLCGTKKVNYGFTGLYAFAGSDDYYNKKSYISIALAPIVVWGIVLLVLNFIVPVEYFWVVYFIQTLNISGAAGDLYVTFKFSKMPDDILVKDAGVSMKVYSKK